MIKSNKIPRRTVLKSGALTLALPMFESLLTSEAVAQQSNLPRLLVIYYPHGCGSVANYWDPTGSGSNFTFGQGRLNQILTPHKADITVFRKMNRAGANSGGAHANAAINFLTALPKGPIATPIAGGISMDQYVSAKNQGQSLFRSLHFGPSPYVSNPVDANNSSVYNCNLSWETTTKPADMLQDPVSAFNSIFTGGSSGGGTGSTQVNPLLHKRSILDYVMDQTQKMKAGLSQADNIKLDEYYTAIRNIEKQNEARIAAAGSGGGGSCSATLPNGGGRFAHEIHTNQFLDMIPLIFSCDLTRVITYQMDFEFGGKDFSGLFPTLGGDGKHHSIAHTPDNINGNITSSSQKLNLIGEWYIERLARILTSLKSVNDPRGGTLLDNTVVLFGSAMFNRLTSHSIQNIPVVLAGKGSGLFSPGKIIDMAGKTHDLVLRAILEKYGYNLNTLNFANGVQSISGL